MESEPRGVPRAQRVISLYCIVYGAYHTLFAQKSACVRGGGKLERCRVADTAAAAPEKCFKCKLRHIFHRKVEKELAGAFFGQASQTLSDFLLSRRVYIFVQFCCGALREKNAKQPKVCKRGKNSSSDGMLRAENLILAWL